MMRIIGHRGASATHPENTLEAFRAAAEQGAHGIELDVRRTADDVLIVYHDAHLPDGSVIRELAAEQLPSEVPTLAAALADSEGMWINVEVKNIPGDPDYDAEHGLSTAVAALLDGFDTAGRVLVSSFDITSVDRIRQIDSSIPVGWLVWAQADPASLIDRAAAHGMQAIHPHELLVDPSFVARATEAGLEVNVWTVDDLTRMRQLIEMGVHGIITNTPAPAVELLRSIESTG